MRSNPLPPLVVPICKRNENVNLTAEQITALAPDPASVKAGRSLAHPAKWPALGRAEGLAWGECQGSGSQPYQVVVDLSGPACKCTCPSRKFPCKHGLGLLFLLVEQAVTVQTGDPPPWAASWRAARRARAEQPAAIKTGKTETKNRPADAGATAKRTIQRLAQMREGGAELALWLADQVRQGLAAWPQQPTSFFRGIAARMVDAKAPGLAAEIARLETLIRSGDGWPQRALGQLGRMHLLTEGLRRFETLPGPVQADLRAGLGWPLEKDEVLAEAAPVADDWDLVGQVFTERDRLWERRTWLLGRNSAKSALLLDFMHGQRHFAVPLAVGTSLRTRLAFYPAAWPLRALLVDPPQQPVGPVREPAAAHPDFAAALAECAQALAANPWLLAYPCAVAGVVPVRRGRVWRLRDAAGAELPLHVAERDAWALLAISGGRPLPVFGEWNDGGLRVLGAWAEGFHGFVNTI